MVEKKCLTDGWHPCYIVSDGRVAPIDSQKEREHTMKANKEMLHNEYSKVWSDEHMISYCTNKAATMAILPDGGIVVVDKQKIEKDFCFGESGYDYDDAQKAAAYARTSEGYFFRQNMEWFSGWINSLEEAKEISGNYMLHIIDRHYTGQEPDCKIRAIQMVRINEVLDETGPAFLRELPGTKIKLRGCDGHLATVEEIELILQAYKEAAADHEKKIRAYLKRYGTSKVNAWTYWRDA